MRKTLFATAIASAVAGTTIAAPAEAHGQCGWRWSHYWQQTVYGCRSHGPSYYTPYYGPHYRPYYYRPYYGTYYHPYYYPSYYRPYYYPHYYGPRFGIWFNIR